MDNSNRKALGGVTALLVLSEQSKALCKNLIRSLPMNVIPAVSIVALAWNEFDHHLSMAWLAAVSMVSVIRFLISRTALNHRFFVDRPRRTLWIQVALAVVAGVIWAVPPFCVPHIMAGGALLIVLILAMLAGGATMQAGPFAPIGLAFILPVMGVVTYRLIASPGQDCLIIGFNLLVSIIFLVRSLFHNEKSFAGSILLRLEADAMAAQLRKVANTDWLTGIDNRGSFTASFRTMLDSDVPEGRNVILMLLDLDHFKSINDTLGHGAGDQALKETAARLRGVVGNENIVARLGGDEFAVVLTGMTVGEAAQIANRVVDAFQAPAAFGDVEIRLGVSVGMALFPADGTNVEDLMVNADLALYDAKNAGRRCWRRFQSGVCLAA